MWRQNQKCHEVKYNSRLSRAIHELQTSYTRSTDVPYQSNTSSFASYSRSVRDLSVGLAINQSGSRAARQQKEWITWYNR